MSKQEYLEIQKKKEESTRKKQEQILAAINNPQSLFIGKGGYTYWKNPITGKDERFDSYKIMRDYDLDMRLYFQSKKDAEKNKGKTSLKKKIIEKKKKNAKRIDANRGPFVFIVWNSEILTSKQHLAPEIKPETLTRLAILAGCLKWEEHYIMRTNNIMEVNCQLCSTKAKKKDIRKVLMLSSATFARFWEDATSNSYITGSEETGYELSPIFRRGKLKGNFAQKLYTFAFRSWYYQNYTCETKQIDTDNHKRMGKILSMLPYLHTEYNVLCWNPWEEDMNQVKPLTRTDIASILGSDPKNCKRDLDDLCKLTFWSNVTEQFLISEKVSIANSLPNGYYINSSMIYFGLTDFYPLLQTAEWFYKDPKIVQHLDNGVDTGDWSYSFRLDLDDEGIFENGQTISSYTSNANMHT